MVAVNGHPRGEQVREFARPAADTLIADAPADADQIAASVRVWPSRMRLLIICGLSIALWALIVVVLGRLFVRG